MKQNRPLVGCLFPNSRYCAKIKSNCENSNYKKWKMDSNQERTEMNQKLDRLFCLMRCEALVRCERQQHQYFKIQTKCIPLGVIKLV